MRAYNAEILFQLEEDKQKILNMLELEKKIWNEISKLSYDLKARTRLKAVHNKCYYKMRSTFQDAPSQLVIRAEKDVSSKYRSIKSNKHKITKAPIKKNNGIMLDKRLYTVKEDGTIKLTTIEKRITVKIKLYKKIEELFSKFTFGDISIFERNGRIFLTFPFKTEANNIIFKPKAVGIDLGINNLASTSEGIVYSDKKYLGEKRKLRYNKRQLQSCGTKTTKRKLKKIRCKERNKTKNMVHNLANRIINDTQANTIVLEDLSKIKTNTKKGKKFNNKHSQIPYYLIKQVLTYKAPLYGKQVETVNPKFTSQIDCRTKKKDGIRQKGRYVGYDGKILHSDINAAINIAVRSKLPISCNYLAIYGQGIVNSPIVCQSVSFHN